MSPAAKDIIIRLFKEDKITFDEMFTLMGLQQPQNPIPPYQDPIKNPLNPLPTPWRNPGPFPAPWEQQIIYCVGQNSLKQSLENLASGVLI